MFGWYVSTKRASVHHSIAVSFTKIFASAS
jgi:hypothetical protein